MFPRFAKTWLVLFRGRPASTVADRSQQHIVSVHKLGNSLSVSDIADNLKKCSQTKALSEGREIHKSIIKNGFMWSIVLGNRLIQMYGKCGVVDDARAVFDSMSRRNSFTWNIMMGVYVNEGMLKEAKEVFECNLKRDPVSWTIMFAGYAQQGNLQEAIRIFRQMPKRDVISWNAMLDAYVQKHCLHEAIELFQEMPERDVVSWNTMITAYAQHGNVEKALELFQQMSERDVVSWNAIIAGFVEQGELKEAFHFFQQMPIRDVVSWTTMISAYAQQGHLQEAWDLFVKTPQKNVVSWNAMVSAYAQHGQLEKALQLLQHMPQQDTVSWNGLLAGYIQHGHLDAAHQVFQEMPRRDASSWNAMIGAYGQDGQVEEAFNLFEQMVSIKGVQPDTITFINILDACGRSAALDEGKKVHNYILSSELRFDRTVQTALVNMYAKCGCLEDATALFDKMHRRCLISWTVLISAKAQHGNAKEALEAFSQMQLEGMTPNDATYCSVLSVCGHAGLLDEGYHYFVSMSQHHHIVPNLEHYTCMIDLLARIEWLDIGEALINKLPFQADAASWTAFLGSCRRQETLEIGKRAAKNVLDLEEGNSAPYVLLSNIYAAAC